MSFIVIAIYFAGDVPDLSSYVARDLADVERGLLVNHGVRLLSQIDTFNSNEGVRLESKFDIQSQTVRRVEKQRLPNSNSGSPATFQGFVEWVFSEAAGEAVNLVLWGHGTGWRLSDPADKKAFWSSSAILHQKAFNWANNPENVNPTGEAARVPSLFRHQDSVSGKWFGIDATSNAALDVFELVKAIESAGIAVGRTTKPLLNSIGFDACLMGGLEVAYELRGASDYLVASVAREPRDGWFYEGWIKELAYNVNPQELCIAAASTYVDSYLPGGAQSPGGQTVTMSVFSLRQIETFVQALEAFSLQALAEATGPDATLFLDDVGAAVRFATAITYQDNLDILTLFRKLRERLNTRRPQLASHCDRVLELLGGTPKRTRIASGVVLYNGYIEAGPGAAPVNGGCTVFFPPATIADITENTVKNLAKLSISEKYPSWIGLNRKFRT